MNYRKIYHTLLISCICFQVNANPYQSGLDMLLDKSDSINAQLLLEAKKIKGKAGEKIQKMADEICFYSKIKITLAHQLKDSMLLVSYPDLDNAFEGIIRYEETMVEKIRFMVQENDSIIDKTTAKSIGMLTDSLFYAFDNVDVAIKNKVDSLYVNAVSIKNQNSKREIIITNHNSKKVITSINWVMAGLALLLLIGVTIKYRLKSRRVLSYILIAVLMVAGIPLVNPTLMDRITGKKTFVPGWEYYTLEGHKQIAVFMKQSKAKLPFDKLSGLGSLALSNYYKAACTTVNAEQARESYKEISFISSILYPPVSLPDSAIITDQKKMNDFMFCFNPAWFSKYNYTKIRDWNRMIGRGNVQGKSINFKFYNATLNYLLEEDFKLEELKENIDKLKSPAERMKLDLLLKVKAVL